MTWSDEHGFLCHYRWLDLMNTVFYTSRHMTERSELLNTMFFLYVTTHILICRTQFLIHQYTGSDMLNTVLYYVTRYDLISWTQMYTSLHITWSVEHDFKHVTIHNLICWTRFYTRHYTWYDLLNTILHYVTRYDLISLTQNNNKYLNFTISSK
jgi:hypothetical protein